MIYVKKVLFYFLVLASLYSCVEPDPLTELSPLEKDLTITTRDTSVNFAAYKTYAIVDSVIVVSKNSNDTLSNKSPFSDTILSIVNSQLQQDGFIRVNRTQNPDVGINVVSLKFSEQVPAYYYGFVGGGGYYGYPTPAYWGFSSYNYGVPGYYQYYQIDIGSIVIQMIDLKTARSDPATKNLNVIWTAILAGSITDTTLVTNQRITSGIVQAFAQSPYLREGK